MKKEFKHDTVLLNESVDNLNIKKNGIYVDATLGGAGHSKLILDKLENTGHLYCFDQDIWAINNAQEYLKDYDNVTLIHSNFKNLIKELDDLGVNKIDGILFDLGVSSMQIDEEERGFSYRFDGPLDMRMDVTQSLTAKDAVNELPVSELIKIFDKYGEEKNSKRIAHAIIKKREENEICTTKELNELILEAIPKKDFYNAKSHPSKRVFQALRIYVNKELDVFEDALLDSLKILNDDGRICVITFHSLEDRICKYIYKEYTEVSSDFKKLPVIPKEYLPKFELVNKKPILENKQNLELNQRAHSAKLRVIRKINEEC